MLSKWCLSNSGPNCILLIFLATTCLVADNIGWRIRIEAKTNSTIDKYNFIGVDELASDGYDGSPWDILNLTPFSDSYVDIYIPHNDWGNYNGNYATDIRSTETEYHKWSIVLDGLNVEGDISLSFSLDPSIKGWDIELWQADNLVFAITDSHSINISSLYLPREFSITANAKPLSNNNFNKDNFPHKFMLNQNYPNPFNTTTTFRFNLPKSSDVHIVIYDLLSREIIRLVDGNIVTGYYYVTWNGKMSDGQEAPTGIYIARMETPEFNQSIKMLLMK